MFRGGTDWGQGDKATGGQGDRGNGLRVTPVDCSPCLRVPLSPCLFTQTATPCPPSWASENGSGLTGSPAARAASSISGIRGAGSENSSAYAAAAKGASSSV